MPNYKVTSKNFKTVLNNIQIAFENEPKEAKVIWVEALNTMLDDLLSDDFFGTEGQCDPRGDQRD